MYACIVSEVLGWIVHCVSNLDVHLASSYIIECTIHPRTSDSTYACIYRPGLEIKATSLHCYVACMLNTQLLFGYAPQVLTQWQLHMDSSSVSHLTGPAPFSPRGSNNDQWEGGFWNFTWVCRWLESSATWGSDERLNATNIALYFSGKFVPIGSTMHPKHDIMLITFHALLLGKAY